MKIKVNGKECEAYDLIMRRENAQAIIDGKKTVEIRSFNSHYMALFYDKEKRKNLNASDMDAEEPFKETKYVRFHNYNYSWYMDVQIDEIGSVMLDKEGIGGLQQDFDFHELDDELERYKDTPADEIPLVFYLHIKEIVGRKAI
ncbi:hypothetical protein [Bacteroides pyogenes]|uniref:hypothetical protein n=1 Tax=Bacteroides pyogenes TaxID=310300 RepID=UPI003FA008E6